MRSIHDRYAGLSVEGHPSFCIISVADQASAQAALHALANLAAFRSGTNVESRFKSLISASNSSSHFHPSYLIASGEALSRLMGLLNCPDPSIVSPAIALLNNLCAENENRDKARFCSPLTLTHAVNSGIARPYLIS